MEMGNWIKKQELQKENKEKQKTCQEVLGKFFFDLAKLIFTAMVLVAAVSLIVDETKLQHWVLLSSGLIATYSFAYVGYNILKK